MFGDWMGGWVDGCLLYFVLVSLLPDPSAGRP